MSTNSNIEWTDVTWNPLAGCSPVSPGCLHCYAAVMAYRLEKMGQAKYQGLTVLRNGVRTFNGTVRTDEAALTLPLSWKKPRRVFVNSMSDLFHETVPFEFVDKVFAVMASASQHTFQVLTKRPERMAEYLDGRESWIAQAVEQMSWEEGVDWDASEVQNLDHWPLPNVWLGTSVEDQKRANERIPWLLKCPAQVRFLSCEPLLAGLDLTRWMPAVEWVHPVPGDTGSEALSRVGVQLGEEFLQAHVARWVMPRHITSRCKGDGLWAQGKVEVIHYSRHRFTGIYQAKYGDSDRGCVCAEDGAPNVAMLPTLRTGNIVDDPLFCFPIAKAPPRGIDWVIVGGESGGGARACDVAWIRAIVQQCRAAGVACFVKQLGLHSSNLPGCDNPCVGMGRGHYLCDCGDMKHGQVIETAMNDPKGGDMAEWPEDLRVRQMPGGGV